MASIRIIYGSTGGNTEIVAEKTAEVLCAQKHDVTIKRVEQSKPADMLGCDLCVLASPTYGHGVLEEHFIPFQKALKETQLKGQKCAVIGLGDPKYDAQYHIESAAILEDAIKASGGTLVCPALKISRSPVPFLSTRVQKWAEELSKLIK